MDPPSQGYGAAGTNRHESGGSLRLQRKWTRYLRERVRGLLTSRSTRRLRDVTFDLLDVGARNTADKAAAAIKHYHVRNALDVVLARLLRRLLGVDLAQRNLGIGCRHLLQGWRNLSAWAAPVCMKIDQRHLAGDGLSRLTATGHCQRRKAEN